MLSANIWPIYYGSKISLIDKLIELVLQEKKRKNKKLEISMIKLYFEWIMAIKIL